MTPEDRRLLRQAENDARLMASLPFPTLKEILAAARRALNGNSEYSEHSETSTLPAEKDA